MINDVLIEWSLGIDTSKFEQVPAMALGVFDICVKDIVGAIAPFANEGIYVKPFYLLRIEDKFGNPIFENNVSKQVWNKETAFSILEMMKLVTNGIKHPTLKNANGSPVVGGTAIRIRGNEPGKTLCRHFSANCWETGTTKINLTVGLWD